MVIAEAARGIGDPGEEGSPGGVGRALGVALQPYRSPLDGLSRLQGGDQEHHGPGFFDGAEAQVGHLDADIVPGGGLVQAANAHQVGAGLVGARDAGEGFLQGQPEGRGPPARPQGQGDQAGHLGRTQELETKGQMACIDVARQRLARRGFLAGAWRPLVLVEAHGIAGEGPEAAVRGVDLVDAEIHGRRRPGRSGGTSGGRSARGCPRSGPTADRRPGAGRRSRSPKPRPAAAVGRPGPGSERAGAPHGRGSPARACRRDTGSGPTG